MKQVITFDQMFLLWLQEELKPHKDRDVLNFVRKYKKYNSITEWRLNTALRLGLDTLEWQLIDIDNPNKLLPAVIVGPFQGWSQFFKNTFTTTFADLVRIPGAQVWLKTHDRINPIIKKFPASSTIILLQKPNGQYIHIEGGHRICAVAYAQQQKKPITFANKKIRAVIARIPDFYISKLRKYLKEGTNKKPLT